ncbi:MAG: RNA-directed DNA polymerase [Patescibacteria group bacterium]|jgi:RNA-directed DNA polymerase|nr:RNA-directed DNA polymerase [Patescibacteria group bacterium]
MNEMFTYTKLFQAYLDCRKTKRKTINALKFEWDYEKNLDLLLSELKARVYRPGRSICFVVTRPVPREIFAADFRDRIVHHLLIREIIDKGERIFIHDSFACRPGKGTHRAIKRLRDFIRQITVNHKKEIFYAQLDIRGFFMSIDQRILFKLAERLIMKHKRSKKWQEDVLWLAKTIIFHRPKDNYYAKGDRTLFSLIPPHKSLLHQDEFRGLPIGNYSSQFFANLYLNELDYFVKRTLKCRYYIRYVDDFILLHENCDQLKKWRVEIDIFLSKTLGMSLNKNKTKIQSIKKGIDFIGYFIKPNLILSRQKVVRRLKNKLYQANKIFKDNRRVEKEDLVDILSQINSYYGHFSHSYCFNLKKDIFENHLGVFKNFLNSDKKISYLKLKK